MSKTNDKKAVVTAAGAAAIADMVRKEHGQNSVIMANSGVVDRVATIPSGALSLDAAMGLGGYPRGRIVEIFGPESCVVGSTFIQYEVRLPDGRRANHKGGSIERLWERFHDVKPTSDARGKYLRVSTLGAEFFCASINEEDRVFQNRIIDVVKLPAREVYELRTLGGLSTTATAEHRFFNGSKYVRLGDLEPGDRVLVHNKTPYRAENDLPPKQASRAYVYVKHHPVAGTKMVNARISRTSDERRLYTYKRLLLSRATIEAEMNGLALSEYEARLNAGNLEGLRFLNRDDQVHHLDENEGNDALENLVVLPAAEHSRMHALERHNNLRYVAVEDIVEAVIPAGEQPVFDLKMQAPFNNYIADGFVTHNSGKTTLTLHAIANVQKAGGVAAFIDAEHALDPQYATNVGVNMNELLLTQPDNGEQALDVAETLVRSGGVTLIVIDSVAALVPKSELEGDMGDPQMGVHARLMSQALRKLTALASKAQTCIIFINQLRSKIGVIFGSPEVTTGGNALKFYSSIRIDVRRREQLKDGSEAVGNMTHVKVIKNKHAPPFKETDLEIVWGKGIDRYADLLTAAVNTGVITKSSSWYNYGETRIGQGANTAARNLEANPKLAEEIEALVRKDMKL